MESLFLYFRGIGLIFVSLTFEYIVDFVAVDSISAHIERAVYGILRNLIEIVILLYLLVYNFALFSKFALLTLANLEKGYFCFIH